MANITQPLGIENFEIVQTGNSSVSSNGSSTNWTTVAHNLGYAPIPMAFFNNVGLTGIFSSGNIPLPTYSSLTIDTINHVINLQTFLQTAADSTNIYFILFNSTGSTISSLPIKYYLLREKVN